MGQVMDSYKENQRMFWAMSVSSLAESVALASSGRHRRLDAGFIQSLWKSNGAFLKMLHWHLAHNGSLRNVSPSHSSQAPGELVEASPLGTQKAEHSSLRASREPSAQPALISLLLEFHPANLTSP